MNIRRVTNLVLIWYRNENGGLLSDSHNNVNRWKHYFCQLLNVDLCGVNVTQTEIRTDGPLVPQNSSFEVEIAIEKFRRYSLLDIDQILVELIKVGGNTLLSEVHKFVNYVCNKEGLQQQ
jgi:hypothetical protein